MPNKKRKKLFKITIFTDELGNKKGSLKEYRNPFTGAYRTVEKDRRNITGTGELSKTKQVGTRKKGLKKIKSKRPGMGYSKVKYMHGGMTMSSPSLLDNVKTTYEMGGVMEKYAMGGKLKEVMPNQKGLAKLPKEVRNKMGYMKKGGMMKEYRKGGKMEYGHGGMMNGGMMRQHD